MLGRVDAFDLREGSVYGWPVASGSMFRPDGGGGVLADAGAHVLDLITWWFGDWRSLRYRDDADGGVEADCLVELEMQNGARGRIELSRTRTLRNSCVITGERGTIEVGTKTDALLTVRLADGVAVAGRPTVDGEPPPASLVDLFTPQLEAFVAAARGEGQPVVSGREAIPSIELLRACYAQREPWIHPWDIVPVEAANVLEVAR
jgi:predicted dehydrogenase